jgi:hypothetical protein
MATSSLAPITTKILPDTTPINLKLGGAIAAYLPLRKSLTATQRANPPFQPTLAIRRAAKFLETRIRFAALFAALRATPVGNPETHACS